MQKVELEIKKKKPLISIVVPVYGVENYLATCIESILAQTYQNIEVILVDDGSPDNCPEICDTYAQKYPDKIKVYHKKNGGLSDARNFGVSCAEGEFITFIDSDDYIKSDYVEYLYGLLTKYKTDISCVRLTYVSDKQKISYEPFKGDYADNVMTVSEALKCVCTRKDGFDISACGKLYKRSIILEIPYPVGRFYEDLATTCKIFIQCKTISFGTRPVYCYCQREGSILNSVMNQKKIDDGIWASNEQLYYIQKNCPEAINAARVRCAMKAVGFASPALFTQKEGKLYFKQARKYLKPHFKAVIFDHERPFRFKLRCAVTLLGYWPSKIFLYPLLLTWRNHIRNKEG